MTQNLTSTKTTTLRPGKVELNTLATHTESVLSWEFQIKGIPCKVNRLLTEVVAGSYESCTSLSNKAENLDRVCIYFTVTESNTPTPGLAQSAYHELLDLEKASDNDLEAKVSLFGSEKLFSVHSFKISQFAASLVKNSVTFEVTLCLGDSKQ